MVPATTVPGDDANSKFRRVTWHDCAVTRRGRREKRRNAEKGFFSLCAFAPLREANPKTPSRVGIPVISRKGAKAQRQTRTARFLLTYQTILVICRSASSPSFRRAGQGTGHAGIPPQMGYPQLVGVDRGGFADKSRAHRSHQRIPVRQGFQSGNRLNRKETSGRWLFQGLSIQRKGLGPTE
jgi:hypothetical protein